MPFNLNQPASKKPGAIQVMTDQLAEDILMDPDASPAERSVAEAHIAARQAGVENKHEETALNLNEINEERDGIMGLVDTISKAIEPIAGKPSPKKRGSAMSTDDVAFPLEDTRASWDRVHRARNPLTGERKNEQLPYSNEELLRHDGLYQASEKLRALPLSELSRLDKVIDRFAKGEFGPEVRKTLDELFGGSEITEKVLELYGPGASPVNTQQYDPDGGRTAADRTVTQEDESGIEATDNAPPNELPTDTVVKWNKLGGVKRGENRYFDTRDAEQAATMERAAQTLGADTPGARPKLSRVGMVDAEIERVLGDDTSPDKRRALELEITNEYFPPMEAMEERPVYFERMARFSQEDYKKRYRSLERELARRVRKVNARFKAVKATTESAKGGGLDYNDDDIKGLSLNMGTAGLNNSKTDHTNGVLILERSDAKKPMITSAPSLLRRAFQIGEARQRTSEKVGKLQDLFDLLSLSLSSVIDYSARKNERVKDFEERAARGEVAQDELAPDRPKMNFTGRIGYVKYGEPVWVEKLEDLPNDFLIQRGKDGRHYTIGDLKQATADKNAHTAREATYVREVLGRMLAAGDFVELGKKERAKIIQAITAHKKNPNNALASGALNALYRKHVGGVFNEAPTTVNENIVPSESTEITDPVSLDTLEIGYRAYDRPNKPIERNEDGTTASNPGYNVTGPAQPRGNPAADSKNADNMSPATRETPERTQPKDDKPDQIEVVARNIRKGFGGFMGWFKNLNEDDQQKAAVSALRLIKNMSLAGLRNAYGANRTDPINSDEHQKIVALAAKLENHIIEGPQPKDKSDGPFAVNDEGGHFRERPRNEVGSRNTAPVRGKEVRDGGEVRNTEGNSAVAQVLQRSETGRVAGDTAATKVTKLANPLFNNVDVMDETSIDVLVAVDKEFAPLKNEKENLLDKKDRSAEEDLRIAEIDDSYDVLLVKYDPRNAVSDVRKGWLDELQNLDPKDAEFSKARAEVIKANLAKLDEFEARASAKVAGKNAATQETTLADQLQAYLPLAEAKNKPLAGAIKTALKEIAAGRSLKAHEGALVAAKRQFGDLVTRSQTTAQKPVPPTRRASAQNVDQGDSNDTDRQNTGAGESRGDAKDVESGFVGTSDPRQYGKNFNRRVAKVSDSFRFEKPGAELKHEKKLSAFEEYTTVAAFVSEADSFVMFVMPNESIAEARAMHRAAVAAGHQITPKLLHRIYGYVAVSRLGWDLDGNFAMLAADKGSFGEKLLREKGVLGKTIDRTGRELNTFEGLSFTQLVGVDAR